MIRFENILEKVRAYQPDGNLDLLRRAYVFSAREHRDQLRKSGEPYLIHPLEVANILAEMQLDEASVACGLLHDVVEDTLTSIESVEELFGKEVAHIIEGLTKISKMQFSSAEEHQAENFRKMLMAMVDDLRIILVKLADRLHNMRTLQHLSEERRFHIANETLEIYAPLAGRLGIGKIKTELEDLCLKNLEPKAYGVLAARVEAKRKWTEEFIGEVKGILEKNLEENEIPAEITGRTKSIYSIHQKMKRQQIELDQVYDFIALRIISDSVKNCYATLGIIHNTWRPVPGPHQRLHRHAAAERLPLPSYERHHRRRSPVRSPDSNRGDAPRRRAGNRRPLEVQGGQAPRRGRHPELRVAPADHRLAARGQGSRTSSSTTSRSTSTPRTCSASRRRET